MGLLKGEQLFHEGDQTRFVNLAHPLPVYVAVPGDEEGSGPAANPVVHGYLVVEVRASGECDALLREEGSGVGVGILYVNPEYNQAVVPVLVKDSLENWELSATGWTPGAPEVEYDGVSPLAGQGEGVLATGVEGNGEVGRWLEVKLRTAPSGLDKAEAYERSDTCHRNEADDGREPTCGCM